jgi:hypothetical protein
MIQDRKKFLDMFFNYLWLYAVLIVVQIIMYFYYPTYFDIYTQLLNYLYLTFKAIFDFIAYFINYVFVNFETAMVMCGVIVLVGTFYKISINKTLNLVFGGKR